MKGSEVQRLWRVPADSRKCLGTGVAPAGEQGESKGRRKEEGLCFSLHEEGAAAAP